jgi:hypothetical protein
MQGLNVMSAKRFGATIENPNPHDVWKQQDIGGNTILFGFFLFTVKGKDDKLVCNLKTASKTNILEYISYRGYRKIYLKDTNTYLLVKVKDNVIKEVTADLIRVECYHEVKKHGVITLDVSGMTFEFNWKLLDTTYLQYQDQIFNKNFLELMEEFKVPELRDTRYHAYFLFSNTIIKVNEDSYELIPYRDLVAMDRCVWKSHIMNREFEDSDNLPTSEFERFVNNVAGGEQERINAFKSAIGYLEHNYNGSHMGQAIVCYDEEPTDVLNPQGGTGKGLFAQGISNMRESAKLDGKHFKSDDKFRFQTVKNTSQVVIIDDLNKDVSFDTFFSAITDGFTIEKKNVETIKLTPEDSPKLLFSMNAIVSGNGSSHKRRLFILEFSNYYSKHIITGSEKPIEDEHGVLFDRLEWTQDNWNAFTKYMISCITYYLKNGLQPYNLINVGKNTLIQTTSEEFSQWCEGQDFQTNTNYRTKTLFENYRDCYFGDGSDFKQRTFTNMIKKYAGIKNWEFKTATDPVTKLSDFWFHTKVIS